MRTGSCRWRTPWRKWNPGEGTTMGRDPTARWETYRPGSSSHWLHNSPSGLSAAEADAHPGAIE